MCGFAPSYVFKFRLANPTNIANANPDSQTPADRVVPNHVWRLVIVPCGLVLCASLVCVSGFVCIHNLKSKDPSAKGWFCVRLYPIRSQQIKN